MKKDRDATTLPDWIPLLAARVYAECCSYTNRPHEDAIEKLFRSAALKEFWEHLGTQSLLLEHWQKLVRSIVLAVGCVPQNGYGKAGPPNLKESMRESQKQADKLLSAAAEQARKLAGTLNKLDELQAILPIEVASYSLLEHIENILSDEKNQCMEDFKGFRNRLSSSQELNFPGLNVLLLNLAERIEAHPKATRIFHLDPLLMSQKSSWKDVARMLNRAFSTIQQNFLVEILLKEKHWVSLIQTLVDQNRSREDVHPWLSHDKVKTSK